MTLGRTGPAGAKPAPRRVRDLLVAQGFAAADVLICPFPNRSRLAEPDLEPASYQPEFAPLVHRLQALLGGGRALSVLVAGPREAGLLRTHAALQIAHGIGPTGRGIVLADADYARPGLGGLIADPSAEGLTDVVRFGRSVATLLVQPLPEGPWLLPGGSFPEEDPLPMQGDDLRSALFRVAQRCDLALYVAPLKVGEALHPLFGLCDQAILVGEEEAGGDGAAIVEAVRELRSRGVRLAGVVSYARLPTPSDVPAGNPFEPGFLYSPDLPLPEPAPVRAVESPAPGPGARSTPRETAEEHRLPVAESEWESPATTGRTRPVFEPPDLVLPGEPLPAESPEPGAESSSRPLFAALPPLGPVPPPLPVFEPAGEAPGEHERREFAASIATRRSGEETNAAGGGLDLGRGEFAFDAEPPPSRWPLYLVVAMIVAIAGFLFWAWMDRNAKREAAQQPVAVEGPAATAAADSEIAAAAPNPPPATASASPEEGAPGTTGTTAVPEVAAPPGADTTGLVRRAATSAGQQPALAGVDRTSPGAVSPPATAGGAPTTTRQDTSLSQSHRAASEGSATVEPGPRVTPPASPEVAPPPAREVSKPAVREAPPAAADSEFWSVWVSSYKTEKRANVELQFLHRHGYEGRAVLTDLGPDKGMWYRIYAGRYQTRAEAEAARVRLARLPQFADFTWVRRLPRD